jgi:hypothetical protein
MDLMPIVMGLPISLAVVVFAWALSKAGPRIRGLTPAILHDPRFVIDRDNTVRRRNADPFDVRLSGGSFGRRGTVSESAFILVVAQCPLGASTRLTVVPGAPPTYARFYSPGVTGWSGLTVLERGQYCMGPGETVITGRYPGLHIAGFAGDVETAVLAREDVEVALLAIMNTPHCLGVVFEAARMRVAFRSTTKPPATADDIVRMMEQVEQLASVVRPACQQAGLAVRSVPLGAGSIGVDGGAPVSSGLRR